MYYPKLNTIGKKRVRIDRFRGYSHTQLDLKD